MCQDKFEILKIWPSAGTDSSKENSILLLAFCMKEAQSDKIANSHRLTGKQPNLTYARLLTGLRKILGR